MCSFLLGHYKSVPQTPSDFVRLPDPASSESGSGGDTVRIELPGHIIVHWPMERMADAMAWLRAMAQ